MSTYAKLSEVLAARAGASWKVSFGELERLIGAKLPASAFKYPAWWSNNPSNNAMTKIWLKAGWRTEQVDIPGQTVVFRRVAAAEAAGVTAGFGDRTRNFEYASTRAPETKMALPPETGAPRRSAADDFIERPAEDWLEELQDFVERTVTFALGFDPCEPAITPEEWAAAEAEMEAEWDELYGPAVEIAPGKEEKKKGKP